MTSRRSMLKWLPAACVGGWAGLFGKAAAAPAGAKEQEPLASDQPSPYQYRSPIQTDAAAGTYLYSYSYTEFDGDGRIAAQKTATVA